jgi:hypothetical protein
MFSRRSVQFRRIGPLKRHRLPWQLHLKEQELNDRKACGYENSFKAFLEESKCCLARKGVLLSNQCLDNA